MTDLTLKSPMDGYPVEAGGSEGSWVVDPMGGPHPEYPRPLIALTKHGDSWLASLQVTHPKGPAKTPEEAILTLMSNLATFKAQLLHFNNEVLSAAEEAVHRTISVFGQVYQVPDHFDNPQRTKWNYQGTDPNLPQEINQDSGGWWVSRDRQFKYDGGRFSTPESAVKDYMCRLADKMGATLEALK